MLRVGLTGGIATGKSTVAALFEALGCRVLHADQMAHELMAPGQRAYEEVVRAFGRDILKPDGAIDRQKLGAVVFAEPHHRQELERILHPPVIAAIEDEFARLSQKEPGAIALVEAALLVEAGYHKRLDKLIVTICTREQQIERLRKKTGISPAEAGERLAAQLAPEEKRRHADFTIDCSGSLAATGEQVEKVFAELRRLAEHAPAR